MTLLFYVIIVTCLLYTSNIACSVFTVYLTILLLLSLHSLFQMVYYYMLLLVATYPPFCPDVVTIPSDISRLNPLWTMPVLHSLCPHYTNDLPLYKPVLVTENSFYEFLNLVYTLPYKYQRFTPVY